MSNPPKPWKVEYAKSSRSTCKTCKSPIQKKDLRLGKMVQATQFDGFMPAWNHAVCVLQKENQIKSADDVEGFELLRQEDQQKIQKYVDGDLSTSSSAAAYTSAGLDCGVEVSQTSRATCKGCGQKIKKGEIRISAKPEGQGARSLTWNHAKCYMDASPKNSPVEKFSGWDSLSDSDRATLLSSAKNKPSPSKGTEKSIPKDSVKRKRVDGSNSKSKIVKATGDTETTKNKHSKA